MPLNPRELGRRLQKLRKSLKNFPGDPTIDEVHDLRTRARRVEFMLEALELDSTKDEKGILEHLKSIRTRAGKVRDCDVLTSYAVGLGMQDEPGCVIRLVHHLGVERHRQAAKLHSLLQRDGKGLRRRARRARRRVESLAKRFARNKLGLESKRAHGDDAPLHAVSVALRLSRELANVSHLGPKNLHSYRIEVKRLRYILEMAEEETGEQHRLIAELKQVQDKIGEWHDWVELASIAQELLQHRKTCKVLIKIQETRRRRFNEALQITEKLRRRYLRGSELPGDGRKRTAPKSGASLSAPVLVATSEIVA
jgi:CHAD domain-containing protein